MNNILQFEDLKLDDQTHQVWRGNREIYLSKKEYELLCLFLENPRRLLGKKLLYETVWKKEFAGQSNILEVYIKYLRNKLGLLDEPEMIFTVRGYGYILR